MPSQTSTTMLVSIEFGMCRQTRQLKTEAAAIETQANAKPGTVKSSGYYFKQREGKKEIDGLAMLKSFHSEWGNSLKHYARYPFGAMRMLPAALVEQFVKEDQIFRNREPIVWSNWLLNEWPKWSKNPAERMGDLYDPNDFPTEQDCRERFCARIEVLPLADAEKWQHILLIAPNIKEMMQKRQEEATNRIIRENQKKIWTDVMTPLKHVVEMLGRDKCKLHETLIENVIKVVDLVPAYNTIHGDVNLDRAAAAIKEKLGQIDLALLKKSAEDKAAALAAAKELVAEFDPFARSLNLDEETVE